MGDGMGVGVSTGPGCAGPGLGGVCFGCGGGGQWVLPEAVRGAADGGGGHSHAAAIQLLGAAAVRLRVWGSRCRTRSVVPLRFCHFCLLLREIFVPTAAPYGTARCVTVSLCGCPSALLLRGLFLSSDAVLCRDQEGLCVHDPVPFGRDTASSRATPRRSCVSRLSSLVSPDTEEPCTHCATLSLCGGYSTWRRTARHGLSIW